jgi:recombinational DNA repair protein (RecF pathway)
MVTGIGPETDKCLKCGRKLDKGFFVTNEGGIFCDECSGNFENKIFIDKKNLSCLKFLKKENLKTIRNLKIENKDIITQIIHSFVKFYLGENFTEDIKKALKNLRT